MVLDDFEEIMNLQRQLASRVVQENEMEIQIKILEIINSLVKGPGQRITKAQIFTEAEIEGIPEEKTAQVLKTLEDFGHVKKLGTSHYTLA